MKKITTYIFLLLLFGACSGFLDEVDQDKVIPTKTDHYSALLLKECNAAYITFEAIQWMTDEVAEIPARRTSLKSPQKTLYCWKREIEMDENGNRLNVNNAWANAYRAVAICNYVLETIDEAEGTPEEISYLKGEALFYRAMNFFNLVNLYAEPYDPETAAFKLGIPLRTDVAVMPTYTRATLAESYARIEDDLLEARRNFIKSELSKNKWHPSAMACDLLMSRIKLYQQDYDKAIEYATMVIGSISLEYIGTGGVPFITQENNELILSCCSGDQAMTSLTMERGGYMVNPELVSLYDANDLRRNCFFVAKSQPEGTFYYSQKSEPEYTRLGIVNLRGAEAFLNRAEALAMKGNVAEATNDLKSLIAKRYKDPSLVRMPELPERLVQFIQNERRKEFAFEDHHRWFDLRRMKNRPEIRHVFTRVNDMGTVTGTEIYYLLANDKNYTLPIPMKERENNPMIYNNERLEKIPEIKEEIMIP